jgi:hypothetical protein
MRTSPKQLCGIFPGEGQFAARISRPLSTHMFEPDDFQLAEECLLKASLTDELCPSSIKSYSGSIRHFFSLIGRRRLDDLTNTDFDNFIMKMKQTGASNCRIANVISSVKWVLARLQSRGLAGSVNLSLIKKPKISKKETNYSHFADLI